MNFMLYPSSTLWRSLTEGKKTTERFFALLAVLLPISCSCPFSDRRCVILVSLFHRYSVPPLPHSAKLMRATIILAGDILVSVIQYHLMGVGRHCFVKFPLIEWDII